MNRYRKLWIAVVFAVLMMCLLGGCGQRPGPGEIMKKMSDAMNRQENLGIDASICQSGELKDAGEEDSAEEDSAVDVRILRQPMGRTAQFYVKLNGEWIRRAGAAGVNDMDRTLKKLFVDYRDMMHLSENDRELEGRRCYEMTAVMIPLDLVGLLQDAADQLKAAGVTKNIWADDILDDINARMELLVDEETYLPAAMSIEVKKHDRSAVTMDYTFGFPGTMELMVPQEALQVPETENETEEEPEVLPKLYEAPEGAQVLLEFGEKEYALYQNQAVQVYMMRVMRTADDALIADLNLVNSTSTEIDVFTESVAVNHRMFHTTNLFQHVRGSEEVLGTIRIDGLTEADIHEIGALSLQIGAARSVDGQEILESCVNTFVLHHGKERYKIPAGEEMQVIFDDEDLRITAGGAIREEEQVRIPLYLENPGEETCSLTLDGIRDALGNSLDLKIFGEVQSMAMLYAELVIPMNHPAASVEGSELTFRVIGRDLNSMVIHYYYEDIHLVLPPVKNTAEPVDKAEPSETPAAEEAETETIPETGEAAETQEAPEPEAPETAAANS